MGLFDAIGALFGGAPNNANFQAQSANILNPTTVGQANTAYGQAQSGLAQQQDLATALQGQGTQGMANQSVLANALMQQATGTGGPSPAQNMLAQATGQNVANQASLMAGQRGAGSNVGLMARQAAQQGAATQQNAVGQAATMKSNEQIAAEQALGNLSGTQIGQSTGAVNALNQATQNEQGNILSGINAQNNANVAMQSNVNSANAAVAQTNANNTGGLLGGLIGSVGGGITKAAGMAEGGIVSKENPKLAQVPQKDRFQMPDHIKAMANIYHKNYAWGGSVTNIGQLADYSPTGKIANQSPESLSKVGQSLAGSDKPKEQAMPTDKAYEKASLGVDTNVTPSAPINVPGAIGQVPSVALSTPALGSSPAPAAPGLGVDTSLGFDEGGEVEDDKGEEDSETGDKGIQAENGSGNVGNQGSPQATSTVNTSSGSAASSLSHAFDFLNPSSGGGGGSSGGGGGGGLMSMLPMLAMAAAQGAIVPGKAKVQGNSEKNDTVPAMLSPGEVVIPRDVMQSSDPVSGAAKFVAALLKEHDKGHSQETSDFKKALSQAIKSRKK